MSTPQLICLYVSLAVFLAGLIYKIYSWLSARIGPEDISAPKRFSTAIKSIILTVFSPKILTLLKVFVLDIIVQRKVFREDLLRWLAHIFIYGGFTLLLLMHALDFLITSALFSSYAPTLNPFMFLRDLFGALVIIGLAMAVYRRFILGAPRVNTSPMDHYAIIILAVIMLSGVFLEGAKISSFSEFKQMAEDYAGLEPGGEEFKALAAYWVKDYGTVAPKIKPPFDPGALELGKEFNEMSCAYCHSRPQWAFIGYSVAKASSSVSLAMDQAGAPSILWYIHFLACLVGLAYLPFSKFFHMITSPLSLLANSVMDNQSLPANKATRQALELDACMHCAQCSSRCSVGIIFEHIHNLNILPSEKIGSFKSLVHGKHVELRTVTQGAYLCTNCRRCTDVCPAGINLEELWFSMKENLLKKDTPEFLMLSPLSFYRGLRKEDIPEEEYQKPIERAKEAISSACELMEEKERPVTPSKGLALSDQASTFRDCFGCQTCTNVCPVVANYEDPKEKLGMLPHQIMYATGLGIKDLAFGSNMLWDCLTCYQCQEQCPQGVKVTEVLYELKNLAIAEAGEKK